MDDMVRIENTTGRHGVSAFTGRVRNVVSDVFGILFAVIGIAVLVSFIAAVFMVCTSCSTPNRTHVTVRNDADNASVEISVRNGDGGTSSISVRPSLQLLVPVSSGVDTASWSVLPDEEMVRED